MVRADQTPKAQLTARFTAPGGPFEIVEREVRGIPMRVFANPPHTLRDIALLSAGWGDRTYVVYQDERWTYAEHLRQVLGLATVFREEYGLRHGDRIAIAMRNFPEWSPVFYAAMVSGLVVVPLNAWWTAPELAYALDDSGVKLVVADPERTRLIIDKGLPIVEVRGSDTPAPGVRRWADLLAALDPAASPPEVEVSPDDDATILYTSGTTGRPKGAVGTHRNHTTNVHNTLLGGFVAGALANGGEPVTPDPDAPQPGGLCTFPMFHIAGITSLCVTPATGGKLATQYRWDAAEAVELVDREKLTSVSGVPTTMRQLVENAATDPSRLSSLTGVAMGGTPVPPDLIGRIDTNFASVVAPANGYGLTETTSAVVSNTGADYVAHPDSVGRTAPGTDIRVVDPVDPDFEKGLPEGEIGELCFRGPNIVRGYWNNPDATASAFVDGWFRTGDLGTVRDGWIYVLDRLKDVVIRGGENIYCAEVEAALYEHPAVGDVAIVGVPHESLGEEAVAVVHLRPGTSASPEDLQAHVRERLAAFKVPAHVVYRAEPLPRTPSGKILKRDLRGTVLTELQAGKV